MSSSRRLDLAPALREALALARLVKLGEGAAAVAPIAASRIAVVEKAIGAVPDDLVAAWAAVGDAQPSTRGCEGFSPESAVAATGMTDALSYSDVPEGVFLLRATGVRDTYEALANRALYRGRPRPSVPLPPPHRVEIVEVWFGTLEPRCVERERVTLDAWIRDRWGVERPATRKQRAFVEAFQVEVVDDAERVRHPKFGGGVVVERRDDRCMVRFDDGSTRTLLASVLVTGE